MPKKITTILKICEMLGWIIKMGVITIQQRLLVSKLKKVWDLHKGMFSEQVSRKPNATRAF